MSSDPQPIEILIVDDERSIRLLLKRWIEHSFTANVREAGDGLQALEQIMQGGVELVISDINMPVLSGIDMLRLLQGEPVRKDLELLIASQVANEDQVREAISLGVSDYLLKPLQYEWVIGRLKRAAERIRDRRRMHGAEANGVRTRVLVADADPNYCSFVESTLSAELCVQSARSVVETLVKALRFRPDVLLFNPEMPGLSSDFLIDRLSRMPGGDPPKAFELRKKDDVTPAAKGAAGVVTRTFVPEVLESQVVGLLCGGVAPERGVLSWFSALENEMTTALFQSLGMLTGREPEETDAPAEGPGGAYAWIAIEAADGDFTMRLDIESGRDLPRRLTAAMLGTEPEEDDGANPPLDAIQEILNVVAGRLKNSCLERKVQVAIGLPVTGFEPPPPRQAQFQQAQWFRWDGSEPFRVRFDVNPSRGKRA